MIRNPLCLDWHWGLLCVIFGFKGMLVFIKEDYLLKRLRSKWSGGKWRSELNVTVIAILFKTREYTVFGGYFAFVRIVAINGPFLLELIDLEISFCNVYSAMQIVSVLVLYCLYFELIVHQFFFFFKWIAHSSKTNDYLFFFSRLYLLDSLCYFWNGTFKDEFLVIGFKLGVPKRSQHDMVKKEKMDKIFKDKCCIAISLRLQDQQIWWHPQECTKSARNIWFMHLRSWIKTRIHVYRGDATLRPGWSQDHLDLKFFFIYIII